MCDLPRFAPGDRFLIRPPRAAGSRASNQIGLEAALSTRNRDNPYTTTSSGTQRALPKGPITNEEAVQAARRTMLLEVAKARMCGTWLVLDRIGGGGNGDVYRCSGAVRAGEGMEGAVKILRRDRAARSDRIARFRNEVDFLVRRGNQPGVLPLLDHALPDDPAQPSWYVMPLAVPLVTALGVSPEPSAVVTAIGRIAQTLASLAAGGVAHRDIKPDNLFQLNGEWVIGDFGLVKYPEQEQVTRQRPPVGSVLLHGARDAPGRRYRGRRASRCLLAGKDPLGCRGGPS